MERRDRSPESGGMEAIEERGVQQKGDMKRWAAAAGAGAVMLVLVVSTQQGDGVGVAGRGGQGLGAPSSKLFADASGSQGQMVRSETISLLGGVGRQQQLLDAQGMHAKLDADMNALNHIISKSSSTRTSSLLKTSLSARIIAQADEVKQQAAHLATTQTAAQNEDKTLSMSTSQDSAALKTAAAKPKPRAAPKEPSQAQEEKQLEATSSTPFVKDKKWSVAEEGKDMDSFFDSLDGGAAAKEASVREKHSETAAEHVAEEAKHEDEAFRKEEHKAPRVALPKRLQERAEAARKAEEAKQAAAREPAQPKKKAAAAKKPLEMRSAFAEDKLLEHAGGGAKRTDVLAEKQQASMPHRGAAKAEPHKQAAEPKAAKAAKKQEGNSKMSAGTLRKGESDFFSHLSGGAASKGAGSKAAKGDTVNRKISDAQERKSVESFFDKEISSAEKQAHLSSSKAKGGKAAKMSASAATEDLNKYWKSQQESAVKHSAKHAPNPKMSAAEARNDFESYFAKQEKQLKQESKANQKLLAKEEATTAAAAPSGVAKGGSAAAPAKPAAEAASSGGAHAAAAAEGQGGAKADEAAKQAEHSSGGLHALSKAATKAAAQQKSQEELVGLRHALGKQDAMPGGPANADMDKYYDKLAVEAKRQKDKDARRDAKEAPK